jgi:hypothetical protein
MYIDDAACQKVCMHVMTGISTDCSMTMQIRAKHSGAQHLLAKGVPKNRKMHRTFIIDASWNHMKQP